MTIDRSLDLDSIRRFVQVVENVQWQRNADAFVALFAPDGVWTDRTGRRVEGHEALTRFVRTAFAEMPPGHFVIYEVGHVHFIGADVAAVTVNSRPVRPDRTPIAASAAGSALYVLARHRGEFWLAAGHDSFAVRPSRETIEA